MKYQNVLSTGYPNHNLLAATSTFLLLISGCGGESVKDAPKLGTVTGKVTLDGSPLAGATVTFTTADNRTSIGTTDASGIYKPTHGPVAGVVIGENTVKITPTIKREHDQEGKVQEIPSANIPAEYNTETKLKATVKSGANTFDFELKSK